MSVDRDLQNLLPYLNQLEREINREQPTGQNQGVNPQRMYQNIQRMVQDLEHKVKNIPLTSRTSNQLSQTMPVNLNPNSRETRQTDNSRLHLLAEQLRKELQRANLVQEPEISEDENNLSLNAELDFAQGDFDRGYQIRNVGHMHGNQSLPISSNSSNQRVQNMPNNFRENKYSAPRPIQMNDNLSNRNYDVNVNQRSNQKVNRGTQNLRKTERDELVDIEDKLQEIRSAFGKMEQYTRQDHANRDLLRELEQNRSELEELEKERRSLQRIERQMKPKSQSDLNDYHSVLAEQGTPRNERRYSIDINTDIEEQNSGNSGTVTLENYDGYPQSERISRIERLLGKALTKLEIHSKDISQLKSVNVVEQPIFSTPNINRNLTKPDFQSNFNSSRLMDQIQSRKPRSKRPEQDDEVYSLCLTAMDVHQDNKPFLVSMMALITSANTDELRYKLLKTVENVLEGNDDLDDSIGPVSEDINDDGTHISESTKDFLNADLSELVKQIMKPVTAILMTESDKNTVFKSSQMETILARIMSCSGLMGLKTRYWKQFAESLQGSLLRYVGKNVEREKMALELSEIIYNEIHHLRASLSGRTGLTRAQNPTNDERYNFGYNTSLVETQKNIALSVAEVQALTCYGSGEDEESEEGGSIEDENEINNPQTAIRDPDQDNRSSNDSSPVMVPQEETKNQEKTYE